MFAAHVLIFYFPEHKQIIPLLSFFPFFHVRILYKQHELKSFLMKRKNIRDF